MEILNHVPQYNRLWDVTKKQQYLSINVEYGEIPVSYFVKLVCVLVVRVVWVNYKLLYMAEKPQVESTLNQLIYCTARALR